MSDVDRRSAKLSKQTEVDHEDHEDHSVCSESTVNTVINKPIGGLSTPTVLSASSAETSPDEIPAKPPITRKQTLIRTPALEGTSPPPDSFFSQIRANGGGRSPDGSPLPNGASAHTLFQQGSDCSQSAKEFLLSSHEAVSNDSGRGTLDITDETSDKSLSRTSSTETSNTSISQQTGTNQDNPYKDSTGIDLIDFFKHTLQKSPKDKKTLLFLEKELHNFVKDDMAQTKKLHDMNPYDRMLVHRLAAHMGIEHNVDQSGKSVVVGKTDITRIPEYSMTDYLREIDNEAQVKKKILLKKPSSLDERQRERLGKLHLGESSRTKSLEERQERYRNIREKIFKGEEGSQGFEGGSPTLLTASCLSMMQHQGNFDSLRPNLDATRHSHNFRSAEYADRSSLGVSHRRSQQMTKSNSYAGYVSPHGLYGSTQHISPTCPSLLNTSASASHLVAPDCSTYESPPPLMSTPCVDPHIQSQPGSEQKEQISQQAQSAACPTSYAYLVSSDYSSIPVGSLIINPHTMQPHVNADGSMYRFDPSNPPPFMAVTPSQAPPPLNPATPPPPSMMYPTGQYFSTPHAPGQSSVRLIAINQGATPVEGQGQTTVPMPSVQAYTPLQLVGSPGHHYQPLAVPGSQEELMAGAAYAAQLAATPETLAVNSGGQFVQGYNLAQAFPANQFHPVHHHPQHQVHPVATPAYTPVVSSSPTYYAMPPTTPTPPPLLNQPPPPTPPTSGPSHHHHQQQQTLVHQQQHQQQQHQPQQHQAHVVAMHPSHHPHHQPQQIQQPGTTPPQIYSLVHSPSAGSALTFPHPPSSTASMKSWGAAGPAGVLHPHYRPSSPPQQAQQVTINYLGPPPTSTQPQTQLVALPAGSFQQRPLGAVIQLGTAQNFQGQPCLYRPFTPLPGSASLRPRMPSLQLTAVPSHTQVHQRPKFNGAVKQKKGSGKKSTSEEDISGHTVNVVTPLIPGLNGSTSHTFIPSATSNRMYYQSGTMGRMNYRGDTMVMVYAFGPEGQVFKLWAVNNGCDLIELTEKI